MKAPALPSNIRDNVQTSEVSGHKMVSQGCALFRCVRCNRSQFMDTGPMVQLCTGKARDVGK